MKQVIILTLLFAIVIVSFAQPAVPKHSPEYYTTKSKNQKKVANIMLIGGAACTAIGILIPKGEVTDPGFIFTTQYKNDGIRGTFGGVGILSMLSSIPFYLLSAKNKRKANAATVSLNNQNVLFPQHNAFVFKTQPAVTFKLKL